MIYLLDTNVLSDLMRAHPHTEAWMRTLNQADRIVTCAVVRGEVLFGIERLPAGKRRAHLEKIGRQLLADLACEPIPPAAADIYSAIKLSRRRQGMPIEENDLWIAATALAIGATLVTRDSDFDGIDGLSIIALD